MRYHFLKTFRYVLAVILFWLMLTCNLKAQFRNPVSNQTTTFNFEKIKVFQKVDNKFDKVFSKNTCLALEVGFGFISGAAWGTREKIQNHYPEFQRRFPNANPQFWNPDVSWLNKYEGRVYPAPRTNVPVHFTDAYHMLGSASLGGMLGSGLTLTLDTKYNHLNFKQILFRSILIIGARSAGNYLMWEAIY